MQSHLYSLISEQFIELLLVKFEPLSETLSRASIPSSSNMH